MNILQEMSPVQTLGGTDLELNLANELRVPKREVRADVTFLYAPERPQQCLFFLNHYSPRSSGEESLAEHLNSGQAFFPLRDKSSGEFFIVHVHQILYVREAQAQERSRRLPMSLHLEGGTVLHVFTFEPRHAWRSRPIDLLNDPERFIAFALSGPGRIHVNKRHIARVEGL